MCKKRDVWITEKGRKRVRGWQCVRFTLSCLAAILVDLTIQVDLHFL